MISRFAHRSLMLGLLCGVAACAGTPVTEKTEATAPAAEVPQVCSLGPFAEDKYFPAPAFAGQTRAPAAAASPALSVTTLASGLTNPWGLVFLPSGNMLVTERPGRMRIVSPDGKVSEPLQGLPAITAAFGEGLHDIALDPNFAQNRLVYFSYYAPTDGSAGGPIDPQKYGAWMRLPPAEREAQRFAIERTARATLSQDETKLENVQVLFDGANRRLVFDKTGALLIGGATVTWETPQDKASPYGKEVRIMPDGSVPADNPWAKKSGVTGKLFALGFKDPEGAALNPATGELWSTDHGPRGGDEINIVRAGKNYGFPDASYGREYSGEPMVGKGLTAKAGTEQPRYYWNPSPALSGMMFYTGDLFPEWKGNLFVGAMAGRRLIRLTLDGETVTGEEGLLIDLCERIRDVRQGPDGAVYVLTDAEKGRILRLTPKR